MQKPNTYRPDIDGLRAVAVLLVMGYHLAPWGIKGGFVGVDVFFVISGFLISSILYQELASDRFSYKQFYSRRIRRLYPALFLVLVAVLVAGSFLLLPVAFMALAKQVVGGSLFVANVVLWRQSGYFSPDSAFKPLLHLWSLGVEEQYYLLFPPLCILFYRKSKRWSLPTALTCVAIASMVFNVLWAGRDSAMTYFLPMSRLWELILGAMLAWVFAQRGSADQGASGSTWWKSVLGAIGLVSICASAFLINESDPYPGWRALVPTLGSVMVIAAGSQSWVNRTILSSRPAVFTGLISYPLYLWHWPIYSYLEIGQHFWGWPTPRKQTTLIIACSFLLSYLTYRFVELPVRNVGKGPGGRKLALKLFASVAAIGVIGVITLVWQGFPTRFAPQVVALDHDFTTDKSDPWRSGTCFLEANQTAESFSKQCVDAAEASKSPMVFLWGDSHAADLVSGFRGLQREGAEFRLAQYTASSCPPALGLQVAGQPACKAINDAAIARIRSLKPDVVVLSAFWWVADGSKTRANFRASFVRTIHEVAAAGVKRIVILGSVPQWSSEVPTLLIQEVHRHPNEAVSHRLPKTLLIAEDDEFLQLTARSTGATYVPIMDKLCDVTTCLVTSGPEWRDLLTYDKAHFTPHGAELIARSLWGEIVPSNSDSLALPTH